MISKAGFRLLLLLSMAACAVPETAMAQASVDPPAGEADMVWVAPEDGMYYVRYSRWQNGSWSDQVSVHRSQKLATTPAVVTTTSGLKIVAWSEPEGMSSKLWYAYDDGQGWKPAAEFDTGSVSNTGPILLLVDDEPALIWSGFDGQDDEIYEAKWADGTWTRPVQINRPDQYPDTLPFPAQADDGNVRIYWLGFSGSAYELFELTRQDGAWTEEEISEFRTTDVPAIMPDPLSLPAFPKYLVNIDSMAIFQPLSKGGLYYYERFAS